jgi:hypothetical protein
MFRSNVSLATVVLLAFKRTKENPAHGLGPDDKRGFVSVFVRAPHLRWLLTESGEMRRRKEAERETPEGFEVLYPPPPLDADALRRLAESATRLEQLEDASSSLEEP